MRPLLAGLAAAAAIVVGVFLLSHRGDKEATFATGELTGTELATSATGRTVIYKDTSGFRIELRARHLPRLDDGRFYQAWLKATTAPSCRSAASARATATSRCGRGCRRSTTPPSP